MIDILVYILSGYGIASLFLIIRLLIGLGKLEVEFRVTKQMCEKELARLERRIDSHINSEDRLLEQHVTDLKNIYNTLVTVLDEIPREKKDKDSKIDKEVLKG